MLSDSYICHYIQLQHVITQPKPTAAHEARAMPGIQRGSIAVEAAENPSSFGKRLFMHRGKPDAEENEDRAWVVLKALGLQLQRGPSHPCLAPVGNHGHPFL